MVPTRRGRDLSRQAPRAAALALLLAGSTSHAIGAVPASAWDLVRDGGGKQCRLTLRGDLNGKGAAVAMPPGCRLAFPTLKGVALWSEVGDGHLQFEDAGGEPLLAFEADGEGFRTTSPQGDTLALKPASTASHAALVKAVAMAPGHAEPAQAQTDAKPASAKKPAATAVSTQKPAEVAGRYAVLREKTRDTGCMVTLDDKAHGPGSTFKARLAPACRDQGIVIFDPVGWQMAHGQLVLTARKGHTTELITQEDGSWMNDPKKGKTLSLKRI
jgi:hypothetical protein